jgi:hypothetical protein
MPPLPRPFAGFRDFILRGNVVDLAVAIVVGTSFTALVNALVSARKLCFRRPTRRGQRLSPTDTHNHRPAPAALPAGG